MPSEAGGRRTSRARLPAAAKTRRSCGSFKRTPRPARSPRRHSGAPAQPSTPRAAFRTPGTPRRGTNAAQPANPTELPPPLPGEKPLRNPTSSFSLRKEGEGKGGRGRTCTNGKGIGLKHFYEFSWSNQGGGGGRLLKSLFCKEGKGSHRDRGAARNPSLSCIFFFLRFANKSSPKAKKNFFSKLCFSPTCKLE